MQLSKAGLELIKRSEGFRASAYRDVAGILTIGYGHRVLDGEQFPVGITLDQAEQILLADVSLAERAVADHVCVPLTQGQYDALVDFCFNLGAGRLAGSTLLRELNEGRVRAAAEQLLLWDHAAGKTCAGLKARRQAEFRLWVGDESVRSSTAA